jgi:hypothetical protein
MGGSDHSDTSLPYLANGTGRNRSTTVTSRSSIGSIYSVNSAHSGPLSRISHHPSMFPLLFDLHLLGPYPVPRPVSVGPASIRPSVRPLSIAGRPGSIRPTVSRITLSIHVEFVHSIRPNLRSGSTASATPSSASGALMSEAALISSRTMNQEPHLRSVQCFPPLDRRPLHQ